MTESALAPPTDLTNDRSLSVFEELLSRFLKNWRLLGALPLVGGVIGIVLFVVLPTWYRATASFMPEPSQGTKLPTSLSGLAGQLGISIGADAGQSPRLYQELLTSRTVLERVLVARGPAAADHGDSLPVLALVHVSGRNRADSLQRAVKWLRKHIETDVDQKSSVISVEVEARSALLAATITNRLIDEVMTFNAQARQTQARRRREFLEDRTKTAGEELRATEDALTAFYRDNRSFNQSPLLRAQEAKLQRQVSVAQEVYLTLRRNFETARIDEVNDVPALTVIDRAETPMRRARPIGWLCVLVGSATGLLLAIGLTVGPALWVASGSEAVLRAGASPGGDIAR